MWPYDEAMTSGGDVLRVAVCQMNPTVGDLQGNMALASAALAQAEEADADVAVMPEMAITGYPPEDLVLRSGFVADSRATVEKFATQTSRCAAVVGFADGDPSPERTVADRAVIDDDDGPGSNSGVWNALAVCAGGRVVGTYYKRHLPNYAVFDELRYFQRGDDPLTLYEIGGVAVGVTVCEDSWIPDGPVSRLAAAGARVVVNVNGSPFRAGKQSVREQVISDRVAEAGVPVLYANLVGGQDELVFDGGSFVVSPSQQGPQVTARCERFAERVEVIDIELPSPREATSEASVVVVSTRSSRQRDRLAAPLAEPLSESAEQWRALELATRDYVHKSGFSDVCVGLSGGVDSSITATIAADALGAGHVHGVLMPSRYSSGHSIADAEALAANLGIDTRTFAIEGVHAAFTELLSGDSAAPGNLGDLTDQNLQSRIRGVLLMALANEHGWLVLTTGNKSEAAVGYSTLYGDTAGAYAVIKDVWKLTVYELCRWRNAQGAAVIPESVLDKVPSAELRPDQRDDQSLPPYEVLDPILQAYVEGDLGVAEIVEAGLGDLELVQQVCGLVDVAEFKRRQTPIGARVSNKAFGRDRRMPIVNRYRA